MVEILAGMVIPDDDICRLVIYQGEPIGETTLKKHFRRELSQGRAKLRVRHAQALFKNVEAGNATAQIWWDKTRNGIREKLGIELPPPKPGEEETPGEGKTKLETARRVAFLLHIGAELVKRKPAEPATPAPVIAAKPKQPA